MLTKDDVLSVLKKVKYPGFSRDIVSFGIIKDLSVEGGRVRFVLDAPTAKDEVVQEIIETLKGAVRHEEKSVTTITVPLNLLPVE